MDQFVGIRNGIEIGGSREIGAGEDEIPGRHGGPDPGSEVEVHSTTQDQSGLVLREGGLPFLSLSPRELSGPTDEVGV
jgi:hypothetical protein